MIIETAVIPVSILASVVSLAAAFGGRRPRREPGLPVTVTVTIDDPVAGFVRTVARSTRRAADIRRDVERAIHEGY